MRHLIELMDRAGGGVRKPIIVGELGCSTGGTSRKIAEYLKERGGILIIIDWFEGYKVEGEYIIQPGLKGKFEEYMKGCEYILLPVESAIAAGVVKEGLFDFFWIDADHRYSAVKRDIELWLPKVKEGGILAGHDYDATEYKEEFIERDYVESVHHGVTKAVNEKFGIPNRSGPNWWVIKKEGM